MSTSIFVNLVVKDLQRSTDFYEALGYTRNEQFSDENATCIVISDQIYVMLLVEDFFSTFTDKEIVDANTATEAILALSADSKTTVDALFDKALAAGGKPVKETEDRGFMYSSSFQDPDGHQWEIVWMDPGAVAAP
jgi:predicted lactoylglutathione lyase